MKSAEADFMYHIIWYSASFNFAWAAASLAMGTRKGEQDT